MTCISCTVFFLAAIVGVQGLRLDEDHKGGGDEALQMYPEMAALPKVFPMTANEEAMHYQQPRIATAQDEAMKAVSHASQEAKSTKDKFTEDAAKATAESQATVSESEERLHTEQEAHRNLIKQGEAKSEKDVTDTIAKEHTNSAKLMKDAMQQSQATLKEAKDAADDKITVAKAFAAAAEQSKAHTENMVAKKAQMSQKIADDAISDQNAATAQKQEAAAKLPKLSQELEAAKMNLQQKFETRNKLAKILTESGGSNSFQAATKVQALP